MKTSDGRKSPQLFERDQSRKSRETPEMKAYFWGAKKEFSKGRKDVSMSVKTKLSALQKRRKKKGG